MADVAIVDEVVRFTRNDVKGAADPVGTGRRVGEQVFSEFVSQFAQNYVNNGLNVTDGGGLNASVASGQAFISGYDTIIPNSTLVLQADNTTNHLYLKLDTSVVSGETLVDSASYEQNTTGIAPAFSVKLAVIITSGGSISSITEVFPETPFDDLNEELIYSNI